MGEIAITAREFDEIRTLVRNAVGIQLNETKRALVVSRLGKRLRHYGYDSFKQYCEHVRHRDPGGRELLEMINCITTNKTEFFREPHHFTWLRQILLPQVRDRAQATGVRKLRIWSAGCSTGQEPYSIAMVLAEELGTSGWDVRILASDIDTNVLHHAERGEYPEDLLSDIPEPLRSKYCERTSDGFVVAKRVRDLITFRRVNLIERAWPIRIKFDCIFCRNVTIYFDQATQEVLYTQFVKHLEPEGYLVAGHSENLHWLSGLLVPIGGTVYQPAGSRVRGSRRPGARGASRRPPKEQSAPPARGETRRPPKGASMRPKSASLRPKGASMRPKGASMRPKSASLRPKGASMRPKGASMRPKGASMRPKGASMRPAPKGASRRPPKGASVQPAPKGASRRPPAGSRRPSAETSPGPIDVSIQSGGLHVGDEPTVIRTVLGSCIAACIFDPVASVGGMNHFMLPDGCDTESMSMRYGNFAMEALLKEILKKGGHRDRLQAKIFGGAHVLRDSVTGSAIPEGNVRFVREFLATAGIPILAERVGGKVALVIRFETHSGKVMLRTVETKENDEVVGRETRYRRALNTLARQSEREIRATTRIA